MGTCMAKAIDWAKLGWCMTQEVNVGAVKTGMFANGRVRYAAFKGASDAVSSAHADAAAKPKTVDFAAYKAALPSQAAWIDSMEKQFKATNIPKPKDTLSASVNADDAVFSEVITKTQAALDVAATDAAKDLATLKSLPPCQQMTDEDVYRFLPELNPFTEEEMEKHQWDFQNPPAHDDCNKMEETDKAKRAALKPQYFQESEEYLAKRKALRPFAV